MRPLRVTLPPVALLAIAVAQAVASAQELPIPEPEGEASEQQAKLEELRSRIAEVASRAGEWEAKATEFERARLEAPERLAALEAEIASLSSPAEPDVGGAMSVEQLEVLLLGAEQDVRLAQQKADDLTAEADRRGERRRELPEQLASAKARLAEQGSASPPPPEESAEIRAARERLAEVQARALANEVRAVEEELLSFQARGELLEKGIARARRLVELAESRRDALAAVVMERREGEAERAAESALRALDDASALSPSIREAVRGLAQENAELARLRTGEDGLLEAIEDTTRKLQNADRRVSEIEADYERLVRKVESSGLTDAVGFLLRKTRAQMPDVGMYRRFIRMRQERIAEVEARQDELRDELEHLSDLDGLVEAATERLVAASPGSTRGRRVEELLRDLLETKRRHLEALLHDYDTYFQKLVDFDARQRELVEKTETLLLYVDHRILWIPSGTTFRPRLLRDAGPALAWLATPRYWGQLWRALVSVAVDRPAVNLVAALCLGGLAWLLRGLRPRLVTLADEACRPTHIHIRQTTAALGITFLQALPGPTVLAWLAWQLSVSPDATQFVRCIAEGLSGVALVWLSLEVPRRILCERGPAEHFDWPAPAVRALHRDLGWLVVAALPLVFVIRVFEMRAEDDWRESVGRIALIALLAAVASFTHRVVGSEGPLRAILRSAGHLQVPEWRWRILQGAALAAPLLLALAAARGFYWTALQFTGRFHLTLVYLLAVFVLLHLSTRWTLVARRRLTFEQWERERAAREAEREKGEAKGEHTGVSEPEIDLAAIDAQTGRLLSSSTLVVLLLGLWFLWADLVPALAVFDSVELWSTTVTETVELVGPDGSASFENRDRVVPVTLGSLLVALLIAAVTLMLVRNLPGLLEISLFRYLGTQAGERYAYATIAKYGLTLVGGALAFRSVGVGWSNIQWLVAAVGLGLGFGLQEIFANFVSGLIILFERPIRVGDTVTVGSISGTVSKIRIRATWITGFDRKELVVPNKEFVTQQLVNWSLTDPVLRVEVPVGIAYGSDTERAMRELLDVAEANPHVLADPKPQVFFLGFGDSSLDFELRCFSPDVERRLVILHELHLAVDRAFRDAGIEIAFPQRDLHLRSVPPGFGASD